MCTLAAQGILEHARRRSDCFIPPLKWISLTWAFVDSIVILRLEYLLLIAILMMWLFKNIIHFYTIWQLNISLQLYWDITSLQLLKGYANQSINWIAGGRWNVAQIKNHVVYTNCSAPFSVCTLLPGGRVDTWCFPNKPNPRWPPAPKPPFAFPRRVPPLRTLHSRFFSIVHCNSLLHFCANSVWWSHLY